MEGFDPKQNSQGLGDTIAKITNFFGIDKVADAVAKLAGAPGCGCNERFEMLNQLFPYDSKTRKFKKTDFYAWARSHGFTNSVCRQFIKDISLYYKEIKINIIEEE